MKIASGFVLRQVGESFMAVPVGVRTKDVQGLVALSETGALIWNLLEGGATEDDLVDAVCERYEVERDRAREDVLSFLRELSSRGWLEQ